LLNIGVGELIILVLIVFALMMPKHIIQRLKQLRHVINPFRKTTLTSKQATLEQHDTLTTSATSDNTSSPIKDSKNT
jgi:Sec-independent protein translocase protein TatA